ncbi:unnamed protein product [Ixodes pacificus]
MYFDLCYRFDPTLPQIQLGRHRPPYRLLPVIACFTFRTQHFVCAQCEKPFNGRRHYEKKGHAYCETHFEQLFGYVCFVCNLPSAQGYKSLNKMWCPRHFCCSYCDRSLSDKSRFFDIDLRPVCKKCYEKFPSELRKRLMKSAEKSPFNKK